MCYSLVDDKMTAGKYRGELGRMKNAWSQFVMTAYDPEWSRI